jgi:site-specific DNA-cytosine methylase
MKVLELFCGTKSISRAFEERGHETFTVDWEKSFEPTLCADVGLLTVDQIKELCGGIPDVVWASPDCTSYSVAAISRHRRREPNGNLKAVTPYAEKCDKINAHLVKLIKELNPKYWFIENPRGAMRKMDFMQGLPRYTVTYCQYGEERQKPTDIWTNYPQPNFKPPCKQGAPCHIPAPRGAQTGTQGLKNAMERSRIPKELCNHIVDICEK